MELHWPRWRIGTSTVLRCLTAYLFDLFICLICSFVDLLSEGAHFSAGMVTGSMVMQYGGGGGWWWCGDW